VGPDNRGAAYNKFLAMYQGLSASEAAEPGEASPNGQAGVDAVV